MLPANKTVLMADDDDDDRFLFEQAWEAAGIEAPLKTVAGGREAVAFLSGPQARPALLLLDVKMPVLSGFEVLKWIRSRDDLRTMPVIMLTASTSPKDVEEAFRLCANSFLVKPSSLEELVDMLRKFRDYWLRLNEFPRP